MSQSSDNNHLPPNASEHQNLANPLYKIGNLIQFFKQELAVGQKRKTNILHLNAHTLYQMGISKYLDPEERNINFLNYQHPQEALEFLEYIFKSGYTVDLIITEVRLPELSGFEFAKQLRSIESSLGRKVIPILAISLYDESHPLIQEALHANYFNKYLTLNSESEKIQKAIDALLHS